MKPRPRAWVLNLGADDERARGPGWTPSRALQTRLDALCHALARSPLLHPDDVVIDRECPQWLGDAYDGAAWSPTERARALWRRAGVRAPETPTDSVLSRVSSRAFAQGLRPVEPREERVDRPGFSLWNPPATPVRVSLAHTCAGRGHWWSDDPAQTRAVITRLLARHPEVFVAPRVRVAREFALHGWLARDGALTLGWPTEQRVDPRSGSWRETLPTDALSRDAREALEDCAREAGEALGREGYFGPFGVDAFAYGNDDDSLRFCPRSEVNARYTMGWAVGMSRGAPRPSDLLR